MTDKIQQLSSLVEEKEELEKKLLELDDKIMALRHTIDSSLLEIVESFKNQYVKFDRYIMYVEDGTITDGKYLSYVTLHGKGYGLDFNSIFFIIEARLYEYSNYEIITKEEYNRIIGKQMNDLKNLMV